MVELLGFIKDNFKETVVLLSAILIFVLTLFKEKNFHRNKIRPLLSVQHIDTQYDLKDTSFVPAIQIHDKYHNEFEKIQRQLGRLVSFEFLVIKNISKNIAISIEVETVNGNGGGDDAKTWSKKFSFESLLPDHHIIIPLGTPEITHMLDNLSTKIKYRSISGEKLVYKSRAFSKVVMDSEKPKRIYITSISKYYFNIFPLPVVYFSEGEYYSYTIHNKK